MDTELIRKAWWRKMTCKQKALWEYLRLACDASGVIDIDWEAFSFHIGDQVSKQDLDPMKTQFEFLPNNRLLIVDFVAFQYGRLSEDCRPHQRIMALIKKNGIERVLDRVWHTLEDKDKDKEEDKDKNKKKTFKNWTPEEFAQDVKRANEGLTLSLDEEKDFIGYWSEPNSMGRPKYSLEKTWDTHRRMLTAVRIVYGKNRKPVAQTSGFVWKE